MGGDDERMLLRARAPAAATRRRRMTSLLPLCALCVLFTYNCYTIFTKPTPTAPHAQAAFEQCAIDAFLDTGLPFLAGAAPLPLAEFAARRDRLAAALLADGADAYVVEPGYAFAYYANVTQHDWEAWEPEERPFLMVVRPAVTPAGAVVANTSFLVPAFEEARARLLRMPFAAPIQTVPWQEHWSPYATLRAAWGGGGGAPRLMVDDEMRDFIVRGLGAAGFDVVGLPGTAAEAVRQTKTAREVALLRAVNTGTLAAVRAVRGCLRRGVTERETAAALDATLRAGGLEPFFDIVEFDEDAALPHGGADGSKALAERALVLIDVGAHLHGYSSDVCRTFFAPFFAPPADAADDADADPVVAEKVRVWHVVKRAQEASRRAMRAGAKAAEVDLAARAVIGAAGYGDGFTHRVGHGIGIKAHESPYLNQGNWADELKAGMVFTSEPGVYLWNRFGVRHEDIYLVTEDGEPEVLSGTEARGPWDP